MSDKEQRPPLPAPRTLAVVNWEYPDHTVVAGCPIDFAAAEAMARAYRERYPGRRSWLSIPAPLIDTH